MKRTSVEPSPGRTRMDASRTRARFLMTLPLVAVLATSAVLAGINRQAGPRVHRRPRPAAPVYAQPDPDPPSLGIPGASFQSDEALRSAGVRSGENETGPVTAEGATML